MHGAGCHIRNGKSDHNSNDSVTTTASSPSAPPSRSAESHRRRGLLLSAAGLTAAATSTAVVVGPAEPAWAALFRGRPAPGLLLLDARGDGDSGPAFPVVRNEQQQADADAVPAVCPEYALLRVLPVRNPVFLTVAQNVEAVSALRSGDDGGIAGGPGTGADGTWRRAERSVDTALSLLANKRGQLEPVFNPEDSTELAIMKAERGEVLIGELFQGLEGLKAAIEARNATCTFERQRGALLNLGFLGELLVREFPYDVPSKGKYSFLPRLMGRARVTFRFKRAGAVLGDVTIVADGYTAPITAGNFVDLCVRNFYTGLPVRETTKRVGSYQEPVSLSINVLGTFNEGFYDPLTGKLRRIPLEIIRLEGKPKLSYTFSRRFLESTSLEEVPGEGTFLSAPAITSKPLVTFETPGLVAFNHPSNDPNGGSSEFFGLQQATSPSSSAAAAASSSNSKANAKRNLLDGLYAPFGYIIEGIDIFNSLQPDDVIHSTTVDEFGQLNLIKIRSSSFKEVAQGTEEAGKNNIINEEIQSGGK